MRKMSKTVFGVVMLVLGLALSGTVCVAAEADNTSLEISSPKDELRKGLEDLKSARNKFLQVSDAVIERVQSHELTMPLLDADMEKFTSEVENFILQFKPTGRVSINIDKLIDLSQSKLKELDGKAGFEESVTIWKNNFKSLTELKSELLNQVKLTNQQLTRVVQLKGVAIEYLKAKDSEVAVGELKKFVEGTKDFNKIFKEKVDSWLTKAEHTEQSIPQ